MTSFDAHAVNCAEHNFEACGFHYGADYHLTGVTSQSQGRPIRVKFSIQYSQEFRPKYFSGYLRSDGALVGSQGWAEDYTTHQYRFILRRTPPDIMCRRPSPVEFRLKKARALWTFACAAVRYQVRKERWSWSFFAERRDTRLSLIKFDIRNYTAFGRPLDSDERAEWTLRRGAITALDATFYRLVRDKQLRTIPAHL